MQTLIHSLVVSYHRTEPFAAPVYDATMGPFADFSPSVLRVRTRDGLEGIALTTPIESEVIRTAIPMLMSGEILGDVAISMTRVLVGFATGSLAGIITGVLLGRIRVLHDLLDPIIELLRYLSPTAMIPIAVIWFGIGEMSKYFLIFWGTFFIVVINTTAGVWRAPVARQRAAQCLGAGQLQIFVLGQAAFMLYLLEENILLSCVV